MRQDQQERVDVFAIPDNAIRSGRFLGFKWTHWAEMGVYELIVLNILWRINFVSRVKGISMVVIGATILIVTLRGIRGRTLCECFVNAISGMLNKKEYHLGGISDDRKAAEQTQFEGLSGVERVQLFFQLKNKELAERYGEDSSETSSETDQNNSDNE